MLGNDRLKFRIANILLAAIALATLGSSITDEEFYYECVTGANETPVQTTRNMFWMTLGFPGTAQRDCLTSESSDQAAANALIPVVGLVGEVDTIRSSIGNAARLRLGSNANCASFPTTGSFYMGPGKIVYFETPQNTIPATFPNSGGNYGKRIRYVNSNTGETIKFEFDCDNDRMFATKTKTLSGGTFKLALYYDNTTSTKYVDSYWNDAGSLTGSNINMATAVRVNEADKKFQLWLTRTGYRASQSAPQDWSAYRFSIHANYETQNVSFHYQDTNSVSLTTANYATFADINSTSVSTTNPPDGSGGGGASEERQGCAEQYYSGANLKSGFDAVINTISSATLCTGLALSAPPTTAFGDTFSFQSIHENMVTRIDALP